MTDIDPRGGLGYPVEMQRGLTDDEIYALLTTGAEPDLSVPAEDVDVPELEMDLEDGGMTADEALAFLGASPLVAAGGSGAPGELTFRFDPEQKRDDHGRWTDRDSNVVGEVPLTKAAALDATPLTIGNSRSELRCRPESLAICDDDERSRQLAASAREYRSKNYEDINNLLRHNDPGEDYDEDQIRGWITDLDEMMRASRLPNAVITLRGMADASGIFGDSVDGDDDLSGYEWTEKAFVSTTVDPDIADHFGESVVMHIRVPADTGAVQLSRMSEGSRRDEAELLLDRGLKMRVVRDRGRDRLNRRILDVEVVSS